MHTGEQIPVIPENASLKQALLEMSNKGLGMTAIADQNNVLLGIYTDGDLRRTLDTDADIKTAMVRNHMTRHCVTIEADLIASAALTLMQNKAINGLIVTHNDGTIRGALNMHDLLRAGIV
jgi:arabinose-5-phosphate isomerase